VLKQVIRRWLLGETVSDPKSPPKKIAFFLEDVTYRISGK
jgi:hypothetical protein